MSSDTITLSACGQACLNYPNNKFAISLQYLKTAVSDEVDFLHAGKHESFLQIDTMILMGQEWSSIPKVPKIASLQCLYNISKKELDMKLIFCMYINIKASCKVILSLLLGMTKQAF